MSVRLSVDEAWDVIAQSHTGILTTLRTDGVPITLPVWFVVVERTVCLTTPSGTKKIARVRRDPRASFLVESGLRWDELRAVQLTGRVSVVDDHELADRVDAELNAKYAVFRTPATEMPESTRRHYAAMMLLQFHPDERILSWDNRRLQRSS